MHVFLFFLSVQDGYGHGYNILDCKNCCSSGHCELPAILAGKKDAIVGVCHQTSDGREHKLIQCGGPEQDTQ